MEWLKTALMVVQVCSALAIILLVLLQQGKGADMGAAFGSGASGSVFGASGSANFLSHATAVLAFVFFAATIAITWCSKAIAWNRRSRGRASLRRKAFTSARAKGL